MPCVVSDEEAAQYERASNRERYNLEMDNAGLVETVACAISKVLTNKQISELPYYARLWIEDHRKADAVREQEKLERERVEKLRRGALAKLSKAEREALNLD